MTNCLPLPSLTSPTPPSPRRRKANAQSPLPHLLPPAATAATEEFKTAGGLSDSNADKHPGSTTAPAPQPAEEQTTDKPSFTTLSAQQIAALNKQGMLSAGGVDPVQFEKDRKRQAQLEQQEQIKQQIEQRAAQRRAAEEQQRLAEEEDMRRVAQVGARPCGCATIWLLTSLGHGHPFSCRSPRSKRCFA